MSDRPRIDVTGSPTKLSVTSKEEAPTMIRSQDVRGPSLIGIAALYDGAGFSDESLRQLYGQSSGMVAFVDESYRAPKQALGGNSFYILTAVLIPRDRIVTTRSKLLEIAAVEKWHTSEEARDADGREKILKMSRYLARVSGSVIAVMSKISPADKDAEDARRSCFGALLEGMCQGNLVTETGLVVIERRRDAAQQKEDGQTINALRRNRRIHETLFVHQGSPATEALLWAPDVISWAARQEIALDSPKYLEPLRRLNRIRQITVR